MSKTTMSPKTPASTRIVTGPRTRFSYCHLWEPRSSYGNEPKYSMSCIIPKDDTKTVALINGAIEAAYREGEAKLKGKGAMPPLSALRTPLRDGDLTVRMIRPMPAAGSSGRRPPGSPRSWIGTTIPSWIPARSTPAATAGSR